MWMTTFVKEVKRQLRDKFGFTPTRMADDEPCFDYLPDGIYPMTIENKLWYVTIVNQRFFFFDKLASPVTEIEERP